MRYHFKVHKEKHGGFWAESLEKGMGVTTEGDTLDELKENLQEALNLALDEHEDSKWIPPMPNYSLKGRTVVEISVDPQIALATLVRKARLERGITQRQAAEQLGIKHLHQYQKLESGKTANAELRTLAKLKKLFPSLSLDAVLA